MQDMIFNAITTNILDIVIAVLSIVVSYYIIPCIKKDLVPWLKEKHLYHSVKNFVQAAEKLAEAGIIDKADKKQKVVELLEQNGVVVTDVVDAFIESCVKELDLIEKTVKEEIMEENK